MGPAGGDLDVHRPRALAFEEFAQHGASALHGRLGDGAPQWRGQRQPANPGLSELKVEQPGALFQHSGKRQGEDRHATAAGSPQAQCVVGPALHPENRQRRAASARPGLQSDAVAQVVAIKG